MKVHILLTVKYFVSISTFSLNGIDSIAAANAFKSSVKYSEYLEISTSQLFSDSKTKWSSSETGAFTRKLKSFVTFSSISIISSKY